MRVLTPQIAFHGRDGGKNDPILSVDFHPMEYLAATAGGDNNVKLWLVSPPADDTCEEKKDDVNREEQKDPGPQKGTDVLTFQVSLSGHSKSVNVVRFSSNGKFLASAGDDGIISIWRLSDGGNAKSWQAVRVDTELTRTTLRGHGCDIYDLAWAPEGNTLVSGAIDSSVILWSFDMETGRGKVYKRYELHSHYVQGLAWDPYQQFFVSQSCDRTCRVYSQGKPRKKRKDLKAITKFSSIATLDRRALDGKEETRKDDGDDVDAVKVDSVANGTNESETARMRKYERLFLDDSVPTFFRRPSFSPDGSILVLPTAQHSLDGSESMSSAQARPVVPATFVYARDSWSSPALRLNTNMKASIGVRFSPLLYNLLPSKQDPWLQLPYRMVLAVLTLNGVAIYDTQHDYPLAVAENIHFAQMTDLSWSHDGRSLVVSSQDGYVSIIHFSEHELGTKAESTEFPVPMNIRFFKATVKVTDGAKTLSNIGTTSAKAQPAVQPSNDGTPLRKEGLKTEEPLSQVSTNNENSGKPKAPRRMKPTLLQPKRRADLKLLQPNTESASLQPKRRVALTSLEPKKNLEASSSPKLGDQRTVQTVRNDRKADGSKPENCDQGTAKKRVELTTVTPTKKRVTPTLVKPMSNATNLTPGGTRVTKSPSSATGARRVQLVSDSGEKQVESLNEDETKSGCKKRRVQPVLLTPLSKVSKS